MLTGEDAPIDDRFGDPIDPIIAQFDRADLIADAASAGGSPPAGSHRGAGPTQGI
jgi:hypothetical protein